MVQNSAVNAGSHFNQNIMKSDDYTVPEGLGLGVTAGNSERGMEGKEILEQSMQVLSKTKEKPTSMSCPPQLTHKGSQVA